MNYYLNPSMLTSVFTVPTVLVDNHLKFAKPEHVKAILYILKNMSEDLEITDIANNTNLSEYDVKEALLYWADAGILLPKEASITKQKTTSKAVIRNEKPTRNDVAKRGNDVKVRFLLQETQMKFGRNLKSNETSTLLWLYDDQGLDVSLILLIVQYAVQHNKANIRFIESVAVDWIDKGIDNITDADIELRKMSTSEQAWKIVSSAFGLERRKPSKKETELSNTWIEEWKISKELLVAAYDKCVNAKSKFNFPYVATIIESWHNKGYKTPGDIEEKPQDNTSSPAYDLDLFEKMLNSKD